MTAARFDAEKFRKVCRLINEGATEGERAAAKARAEAMASRAGMTLKQAMAKIDAKVASHPTLKSNPFEQFFNSPEMRAQRAERAAKNAVKREALVKEYGSVVTLFDPTPWEIALRDAVEPFSLLMPYACVSGVQRIYTQVMDGEHCGDFLKGTAKAKEAIASAIPMPGSLGAALSEVKTWDRLRRNREAFFDVAYGYNEEPEVYVRRRMVQKFLERAPAGSWEDMEARFEWKRHEFEMEYLDPVERDDPFLDRLEADFAILRELYGEHSQPTEPADDIHDPSKSGPIFNSATATYRTNADRKAAVFAAIRDNPGLGDSDIATIAGVTRQTVNNWRRRKDREAAAA